jgi:GAF domain-containing protein
MILEKEELTAEDKSELYKSLTKKLFLLVNSDHDYISNAANFVAIIYQNLPEINWTGIYFYRSGKLKLGPFQGMQATPTIELGSDLSGSAANQKKTLVIDDSNIYPGQQIGTSSSSSAIAVPLIKDGHLLGVLQLTSDALNRFDAEDKAGLENLCEVFLMILK